MLDILQYRLDKLAEAGLDIWATELTVDEADDVKKAVALEKLLTLYFSHPSVGGVILWHFWNESLWHPNENLFDGPDIKVMYPCLVCFEFYVQVENFSVSWRCHLCWGRTAHFDLYPALMAILWRASPTVTRGTRL